MFLVSWIQLGLSRNAFFKKEQMGSLNVHLWMNGEELSSEVEFGDQNLLFGSTEV
jgi:hypothetical protein